MAAQVQSLDNLKKRVGKAFMRLMKYYGFYRRQFKLLRIKLRPKTVNWNAQTLLSNEHPEHRRITRIISLLRIFDLQTEAQAFYAALTTESERITSKVGAKSRLQWNATMTQNTTKHISHRTNTGVI
jgi:hypothetical protein